MYDKASSRFVSKGKLKFDIMECKIPVLTINGVVANAKILDIF